MKENPVKIELTIGTVSYNHAEHISENIHLTKALNPDSKIGWLIVNNALKDDKINRLSNNAGVSVKVIEGVPNTFKGTGKESCHHASGIDLIASNVKTRFLLILDPDFYLIAPDWAERVIRYMMQEDIAIFGVPWHPKWRIKYRYFPCVHCLFIDTSRIDLSSLTFMPRFEEKPSLNFLRNIVSKIPMFSQRAFIGCSKDTGYRLYEKYYNLNLVKYGVVVPSYTYEDFLYVRNLHKSIIKLWFTMNKVIDKIMPDTMSIFPKKKDYSTDKCFAGSDLPDCKGMDWEEFFWEGKPFGFHVRGFQKKQEDRTGEIEKIHNVLKRFTEI